MWRSTTRILQRNGPALFRSATRRSFCLAATDSKVKESSSVLQDAEQYKAGDKVSGYTVKKVGPVPEFDMVAILLTHDATGAEHLHLARDDSNNVFNVALKTPPFDSTGVPHILEHVTLCGSKRYPCRDPFFAMTDRSVATFMNAMTGHAYTMYPFQTQNHKDYENLLRVYLDAVYFPNLRQMDFWQEGWRLEHEGVRNKDSPLIIKGVVFNEMKGAMCDRDRIYHHHVQRNLLPSHTYYHLSGGDPLAIPDLTWEQLKQFHSRHYHPSNSRFLTYGDIPLEKHLPLINDLALHHFTKLDPRTDIPHEPRWTEPREVHLSCAPDPLAPDPAKQTIVSRNYVLDPECNKDPFETFTVNTIINLMLSGPAAPFTRALIEPNIGAGYAPYSGGSLSSNDAEFSIGLDGISQEDIPRVLEIIDHTFDKIIEEGFEKERVDAVLHSVELALKHQTPKFGLGLAMNVMTPWIHKFDPIDMLYCNSVVERFKENIKSKTFLQDKVLQYFKGNPHCLTVTMSPSMEFESELKAKEEEKLASIVAGLTPEDKEEIYKRGLALEEEQTKKPDFSCLPKMTLQDIDPLIKPTEVSTTYAGFVPVQVCEQPTNGVTYFRAVSSITSLPEHLKMYLPVFCAVITSVGAGNLDYRQMAQQINLRTGGVSVSPHVISHHTDPFSYEQGIKLSSHCLDSNIPHMFSILQDIFTRPTLDDSERLRTLINAMATSLTDEVIDSGHSYAMLLSGSSLAPEGDLVECFGGLEQIYFLKSIAEKEDLSEVIQHLTEIAVHVLDGTELRCGLNTTKAAVDPAVDAIVEFLDSLPGCRSDLPGLVTEADFEPKQAKTLVQFPSPVNFVCRSVKTVPYNHEDHSKLRILAKILSAKFLHRQIREQGGAYGAGAKGSSGMFSFYSYRDPNSLETLQAFDDSVQWAAEGKFDEESIEEAKITVTAAIDKPVAPAHRGNTLFYHGITDEMRQTARDRILAVSKDDLVEMAQRYLLPGKMPDSHAIIGPRNEAIEKDSSWTVRKDSILPST